MTGNITFTMIKPDAFADGHSGSIIKMIEDAGYEIIAMKLTRLNIENTEQFYKIHREKPFYESLVKYMSSGKIIAMILKKENAVAEFRKFIGSTNPAEAREDTIRKLFGKSIEANAVHGSDSDENSQIEAGLFFSEKERYL